MSTSCRPVHSCGSRCTCCTATLVAPRPSDGHFSTLPATWSGTVEVAASSELDEDLAIGLGRFGDELPRSVVVLRVVREVTAESNHGRILWQLDNALPADVFHAAKVA